MIVVLLVLAVGFYAGWGFGDTWPWRIVCGLAGAVIAAAVHLMIALTWLVITW